jgi:hypothetical protein
MKRNLMSELKEGMDALTERRNIMNKKDFNDLITSVKEAGAILQNEKYKKESEEIEQILGKTLGYPWFKDDQDNFPNATEADGVAVGDHTAWSLAIEAADKIKELQNELNKHNARVHKLTLEEWRTFDQS